MKHAKHYPVQHRHWLLFPYLIILLSLMIFVAPAFAGNNEAVYQTLLNGETSLAVENQCLI